MDIQEAFSKWMDDLKSSIGEEGINRIVEKVVRDMWEAITMGPPSFKRKPGQNRKTRRMLVQANKRRARVSTMPIRTMRNPNAWVLQEDARS